MSDRMDIDSPAQTIMRTGRVSRPPGEWWVAPKEVYIWIKTVTQRVVLSPYRAPTKTRV
jgi:hypothetical protein